MGWTTLIGVGSLVEHDGKLLMIKQHRPYGVHWELPSGFYEPGESFEEAAVREVLEETGVAVAVGALVCTLVWEREHDRRRNVLAFFEAVPVEPSQQPRPQVEEGIEDARWLDPFAVDEGEIHGLELPIIRRWRDEGPTGFHLYTDVTVHPDGTQSYAARAS